jgi:transcriptional regulator GlxA family with amidase domain
MDWRVQAVLKLLESDDSYLKGMKAMDDLAKSVNLSDSRLRHLLKSETGVSWTQFLKRTKIQRARDLLETSYLRVKEIGSSVGINDESFFARTFKREVGVTPSKYRLLALTQGVSIADRVQPQPKNPTNSQKL